MNNLSAPQQPAAIPLIMPIAHCADWQSQQQPVFRPPKLLLRLHIAVHERSRLACQLHTSAAASTACQLLQQDKQHSAAADILPDLHVTTLYH
jgi:hypothetical protein